MSKSVNHLVQTCNTSDIQEDVDWWNPVFSKRLWKIMVACLKTYFIPNCFVCLQDIYFHQFFHSSDKHLIDCVIVTDLFENAKFVILFLF